MVLTGYLRGVRLTTIILVENTVGVDADPVRVVPLIKQEWIYWSEA
jgi:hypothetical protein